MPPFFKRESFSVQRLRRWLWVFAGAVFLATLALASGIVLDEAQVSGREQRRIRAARDAGRDLAIRLATGMRSKECSDLADAASASTFGESARKLLSSSPEIAYLHVVNRQGGILWTSEADSLSADWRGGNPEEFLRSGGRRSRVTDPGDPLEADVFVEMVTAVAGDPRCGAVVLGLSEHGLARVLRRETGRTAAALAGFGLAILVAVASVSRALSRRRGLAIRRRVEAEHLAELGLLAAGLAHELRNPLNAMRFATDSLIHRARKLGPGGISGEMEEITREISGEISGLDRIVSSFLSYARPAKNATEEVELAALARSALSVAQPEIDRAGVAVRIEAPGRALSADLSPGPLRQVLVNLLVNSAQACEPGCTIVLEVGTKADGVYLAVEDDGPGVKPELLESLFQPFITGRREGTGLGLAICRRLVTAMEGTIEHEPVAPHGSRFVVELPQRLSH